MVDLAVRLAGLHLKNPLVLASGTCGYGVEMAPFYDPALPGAITLKGLTLAPRAGNPPPRMAEVAGGVLNAIGLQNMGYDRFVAEKLPLIAASGMTAIANISGETPEHYRELCIRLDALDSIAAVELNVSCPNVSAGGILFGQDERVLGHLVKTCRSALSKPLIVKLSPNVTDITTFARVCEEEGADILTLINTLVGLSVDIRTRRPRIRNVTGGFSGPAIKPVALRMVHQVHRACSLPIIGMGGVWSWEDAVEFLIAGATAVGLGTVNMVNPPAAREILDGLTRFLEESGSPGPAALTGTLRLD